MFNRRPILLKILTVLFLTLTMQTTQSMQYIGWDGNAVYRQGAACFNWLFEKGKHYPAIVVGAVGLVAWECWQYKKERKEKSKGEGEPFVNNGEFEGLVKKSQEFIRDSYLFTFPTQDNLIEVIAKGDLEKQANIVWQAKNTHPIIMGETESLINNFIRCKRICGTDIEKVLYACMDVNAFIDRLLIKRPLVFYTPNDITLLREGQSGQGTFERIGTNGEQEPLILEDYLSYDEMQISALLGVSTPTYFINNGHRDNCGVKSFDGTYQDQGIYIGLVGPRFEKPNVMEWQHMIITREQNQAKGGYGPDAKQDSPKTQLLNLWATFYGLKHFPTFEQAKGDMSGRFVALKNGIYLDTLVYKKRIKMVMDAFLCEAQQRALDMKKKAYCHVVGLGLGYWALDSKLQAGYILEVFGESIKELNLSEVADIDFSHFPSGVKSEMLSNGKIVKYGQNSIKVHFSKRNPADKLDDESKLLVAMYAWDGNAYPGNEYWLGMLSASGDPAAACCSTIPELQNPQINPYLSSANLRTFHSVPK